MSVRPMVKKGLNTISPAEMLASKQKFVALEESYKGLIKFPRKIENNKKTTTSPTLIKGKIKFATTRLENVNNVSNVLEDRFASSNKKPERLETVFAKLIQRERKQVETTQSL